jgi:hypothetical protein
MRAYALSVLAGPVSAGISVPTRAGQKQILKALCKKRVSRLNS